MTTLKHTIEIERPIQEVYDVARRVDRYPEFMPEYLSSEIIGQFPDGILVERSAMIGGKLYRWKSKARFKENEVVAFEHQEGPLHGMQVTWLFDKLGTYQTRLTIHHVLDVKHTVPFWGHILERWFFVPKLKDIAARVVVSFKNACERRPALVSA